MIKKLSVQKINSPEGDVPKKDVSPCIDDFEDVDLKRLPSLKLVFKGVKSDEMLKDFSVSMDKVLELEKLGTVTEDCKKELMIYIMEEIEKFVLKPKAGAEKKKLAIAVLKRMFHNDEIITGIAIDGIMKHIRQVGTVRRLLMKAFRFFLKKW
jgi:hypothetical protein